MGVIWNKIWLDFWGNKGRTIQIVLIVAVGAFAIGMIINARNLMADGMDRLWSTANPMMIGLAVNPAVDDDTLLVLKHIDGVEDVEGQMQASVEWRLSPDQEWQSGYLVARGDYQDQTYAVLDLMSGEWPREKNAAIGQGVEGKYGIHEGNPVAIKVNDREHTLNVTGTVYNNYVQPPGFGGPAQFYVDRDRFDYLTGEYNFTEIMANIPEYDEDTAREIANEMQDKLEAAGVDSYGSTPPEGERYVDPSQHFFQSTMDGLFLVMGIMGTLALILGLFLVYNTINALISRQVDQIGIMKAIGARTGDIMVIYLLNVLLYGILALAVALPLGGIGGWLLCNALMQSFSSPPEPFRITTAALLAQIAICMLAPLLASLVPILSGSRITVREAISTYGLSTSAGLVDRVLAKSQQLPRTVTLTISNTFRHKWRVVLTQITLVMSGLIFMMVMSVGDSVTHTFTDVIFSILNFNVTLQFEDPERMERVEELTIEHPDVKAVEMWAVDGPKIRAQGQKESDDDKGTLLFGIPVPTELYGVQLRTGRWLQPDDTYAIVMNEKFANDEGYQVGDWVTLDHGVKGDSDWQIVGLVFDPILTTALYAPRDPVLKETHSTNKAQTVWIQTTRDDYDSEAAIAKDLRQFYENNQLKMNPTSVFGPQGDTATGIAANIIGQFNMIIMLLLVMAVVIGIVGSIALSGVLSLNVLERQREIGVMRSIGASSITILGIFIGEGLILGWLSCLIALPLSVPAGRAMTHAIGSALGGLSLVYKYTPQGALLWFVIITVLSIVASYFPARAATRISVRESLSYQ